MIVLLGKVYKSFSISSFNKIQGYDLCCNDSSTSCWEDPDLSLWEDPSLQTTIDVLIGILSKTKSIMTHTSSTDMAFLKGS